jgi:hypothetical protein
MAWLLMLLLQCRICLQEVQSSLQVLHHVTTTTRVLSNCVACFRMDVAGANALFDLWQL